MRRDALASVPSSEGADAKSLGSADARSLGSADASLEEAPGELSIATSQSASDCALVQYDGCPKALLMFCMLGLPLYCRSLAPVKAVFKAFRLGHVAPLKTRTLAP